MSHLDDMPTPELGQPLQLPPDESVSRRRTPVHGVPYAVADRPSHRVIPVEADDGAPLGTLDDRVTALERAARDARRLAYGAVGGAITALGAILIWALNAREAAGVDKTRLLYLERAVDRLEAHVLRPSGPRRDRDRDEPDEPAPRPAAIVTPGRKDSDP
jgi:hypothetical protein